MKATTVIVVVALLALCVCTEARASALDKLLSPLPKGLKKAIVVDPMAGAGPKDALDHLEKLLGKEPPAASGMGEDAIDEMSDEDPDVMSVEDLKLMQDDSECDKLGESSCKKSENAEEGKGSNSLGFALVEEKEGVKLKLQAETEGPQSATEKAIHALETQIQKAMLISKTIPDAVKKLEELKAKEEKNMEERARKEAVKTLEEHRRLMAEMSNHITKLRTKLNELVAKRAQLSSSDARLRRELGQFSQSGSGSSSSGSSSSGSSSSQHSSSQSS